MINEIDTILKKFDEKFVHKGEDGDDSPEDWAWTIIGSYPIEVKLWLSSHLAELLQQVNHDHEILVNTILDTHKSQLKDLYDDLEGEKVKDVNGKEGKYYRKEWNLALNLAQEKIKKLIK